MRPTLLTGAAASAALLFAALLAGCNQQQASAPQSEPPATETAGGEGLKLYAMDCGHLNVSDLDMFSDDDAYKGKTGELVDPCYLIRHSKGDLVWDVGLPESLADQAAGVSEGPFQITVPKKLTAQLAELSLTPADIEFVSVSHSHFDHIGNGGLFAAASTWIVDADERAHAFRNEARQDPNFASYSALENANTILIEGDGDYDVFGDGSVTIIQAPGHTPGHTILLVKLSKAGAVLLTGDMYHVAESRAGRKVPRFNSDRARTLASMEKVEQIASSTSARVVRQHVKEDFDAMPVFPAALD